MSSGLRFQTVQIETRAPTVGSPTSPRGRATGAAVKLLHKTSVALNRLSVAHQADNAIEARKDDILERIHAHERLLQRSDPRVGVLLVVGAKEWKIPDATGTRARSFLGLHLGGTGISPDRVVRQYFRRPRLVRGVPPGWRRRDEFLWATRAWIGS
ncbi:MAG: hypothetical protein GVY33_07285 [Alphaproteobacteria bacterium]|jgi:hypothetical protein|nr:hypothetical protein [Alphaproteobacteria bacterium]